MNLLKCGNKDIDIKHLCKKMKFKKGIMNIDLFSINHHYNKFTDDYIEQNITIENYDVDDDSDTGFYDINSYMNFWKKEKGMNFVLQSIDIKHELLWNDEKTDYTISNPILNLIFDIEYD